jgi:hypothetical protein
MNLHAATVGKAMLHAMVQWRGIRNESRAE